MTSKRKAGVGCLLFCLAIAVLFALDWERTKLQVALIIAVINHESRPDFLEDAQWQKPNSAQLIRQRFSSGTPETELLQTLKAEGFLVNKSNRTAKRTLKNLPCNELLVVAWKVDNQSRITHIEGSAADGGCL